MRLRSFLAVSALAATALVPLAAAQGAEQSPSALRLRPATTSADVQRILATDETAHAGPDGHLYYVDPAPVGAPRLRTTAESTTAESSTDDHTTSEAAVPMLHSRPGSTHTIYLDFGGGSLAADNKWVTKSAPKMSSGSYNGFSLDGNYADYTTTEVTFITKVWKIVAEKFAPWDIDVTTQNPGVNAYTRSSEADTEYGTHVVITTETGTGSPHKEICNQNCAGIAWNEVFSEPGNAGYEPAWVFASKTIPSAQMTAHDAAHEIGHTLGLEHDGTASASYYGGHANWVPIMGITNQKAVAQWSKGEYAGANNTENDLAVIGANGDNLAPGSLLLPDDYPNSGATPAPLTGAASYQANGIISSAADSDVFTIIGSCTNLQASATSIDTLENAGQTLDIKLDVLNASNSQLESNGAGTSDQNIAIAKSDGDVGYSPTGMDATVSHTATPGGEYRIRVSGTSSGTASNGYTTYGSIGSYHLTVTGCTTDPGATAPGAPTGVSATPNARTTTAKVTWTPSSGTVSGYKFTVDGSPIALNAGAGATSATIPGLTPGQNHAVRVIAYGPGGESAPSGSASVRIDTYVPSAGPGVSVSVSGTKPTFHWTVPDNPGRAVLTGWRVEVFRGATKIADDAAIPPGVIGGSFGSLPLGSYSVRVTPQYTADDTAGIKSTTTSFAIIAKPSAPRIGAASSGTKGKPITAGIKWAAPSSTGGSPITAYKVVAYKLNARGTVARTYVSSARPAGARSYVWKLPKGRYKFRVVAYNKAGASPGSAYSKIATAR